MESDNELNENSKPFVPEYVPDEITDSTEWYEALVTEIVWRTGRTLPLNPTMQTFLNQNIRMGIPPEKVATFIIGRLDFVEV